MFALTVTTKNGQTETGTQYFRGDLIQRIRPTTLNNTATAARFEYLENGENVTYSVSETAAAVAALVTTDMAEAGAELLANKATTFATINDTLYPSVEAVVEVAQPIWYAATTGTDTYTATLTGIVPTAYYAGMMVKLNIGTTNTGAATINLNGLGAKAIKKSPGTALTAVAVVAGDLVSGFVYTLIYDGVNFQVKVDNNDYGATSGTDTYTVTLNYPSAYTTGRPIYVKFGNTNATTTPTLNVNSLGAKTIVKGTDGATALSASDLVVTKIYTLIYDGTNFQINI